jgi:peptidoglycan/LPS O-acetylase OafA/YrhL
MTSTVSAPGVSPAHAAPPARPAREVRRDIQGLRAIAVGIVVLFHAWPRRMPGGYVGVDVFFVISGFLISGHLMAAPPARAWDLGRFWARRVRRLLPAALLVLVTTLVVSRLVAPSVGWGNTAREVLASAFYVENWSLAGQAVDYLAADTAPTPVQHFWSLSVEEQFYLVWPVLLLVAGLVARRLRRRQAGFVLLALAGIFALSLWLSVRTTEASAAKAYFVTYTRAWEFAAGALVAWAARHLPRPQRLPLVNGVAWLGLGAIVLAAFRFSTATAFPGYAALLPVLGTAAVLLVQADGPRGPGALWRIPGVQWIGDVSYSIYLWHWPALLLAPFVLGSTLKWPTKLLVLAVVLVLSGLSKVLVEDPFRFAKPRVPLRKVFGAAAVAMGVVTVLVGAQVLEVRHANAQAWSELRAAQRSKDPCLGAGALVNGAARCPARSSGKVVPALLIAGKDKSAAYKNKCFVETPLTDRLTCTFGHGPTRVALVGNSHAGHWLPALQRLADERGWTVTTYLISVCNVSDAETYFPTKALRHACSDYSRWVFDQTKGHAYDLIITSERQSSRIPGTNWATVEAEGAKGYRSYLRRWAASGAHVVVIKDLHAPPKKLGRVPDCLAAHEHDWSACDWSYTPKVPKNPQSYRWVDPLARAARELHDPRVDVVSVDDLLCPADTCRPVVGGVVVFFDASHLTATYARSLAPVLGDRIDRALLRRS